MNLDELDQIHNSLYERTKNTIEDAEKIASESMRVARVAADAPHILKDIDREFMSITKLSKTDVAFLFVATALQIMRQYLLTQFSERKDDKQSAKEVKGNAKESSNRHHRYYNPSLAEIISNPVPFDASTYSSGALKGGGMLGHRVTALGHDPILGLIIGTCNIATSTLTNNRFESYHICSGDIKKHGVRDVFGNRANTRLVFEKSADKLLNQGIPGKEIIGTSLIKEIVHLRSDIHSKLSLPIPLVSVIDGKAASNLASYGLDMANVLDVTKQVGYSILINSLIAMVHGLFAPDDISSSLYEVKTRKILSYSNVIASSSNLIFVGANAALGNEDAIRMLDIGGLIVTCYRVATDLHYIEAAKKEFIENNFIELIKGE